ncbi:RNA polymerase I-specific transcription initiation factor RRN3 [Umbelopsis sp. PMI_123]|nr:RNA polymerase I-specific transcription initiation factor RRN3 [Umbelopsis sp. PMI_123]
MPENVMVSRSITYQRVHNAIRYVLSLIPTSATELVNVLAETFPHKRFNVAEQATYVNNLLEILDYAPILRKQVLGLAIERIILIDVEIQIELEDLEDEVELDAFDMNLNADYEDDEDSDDEADSDGEDGAVAEDSDSEDDGDFETETRTANHIKLLVKKLDAMLHIVFRYLKDLSANATVSAEERQQLFFFLLDLFDRTILRTFKSRYTQFLIFYYCSTDTLTFPDAFLGHLFEHTFQTSKPTVTRVAAASYVSSYLARAKYIGRTSLRNAIYILSSWCEHYMDGNELSSSGPDVNRHPVFYAVVQAIMYVFCFRWRELVDDGFDDILKDDLVVESTDQSRHMRGMDADILTGGIGGSFGAKVAGQKWCVGLHPMQRIVTSSLNPLKICSPAVVRQFAKVSNQANFLYVFPILERNKSVFCSSYDPNTQVRIESFFPFDPYQLKSSKHFIDDIYREWIADDDDEDSSDDEDNEDEDDDDDVSAGMMAMSISPSPNQRLMGSILAQRP